MLPTNLQDIFFPWDSEQILEIEEEAIASSQLRAMRGRKTQQAGRYDSSESDASYFIMLANNLVLQVAELSVKEVMFLTSWFTAQLRGISE